MRFLRQAFITSVFLTLASVSECFAVTGYLGTKIDQIKGGYICIGFEQTDLPTHLQVCNGGREGVLSEIQNVGTLSMESAENLLLEEALSLWKQENECLNQRLDVLTSDKFPEEEYPLQYLDEAVPAWLGWKRAQLILEKCSVLFQGLSPSDVEGITEERLSREKSPAKKKLLEDLKADRDNWRKPCANRKTLKALAAANVAFPMSLPILGGEDILNFIEDSRSAIVNFDTGVAITDEDILSIDFTKDDALYDWTYKPQKTVSEVQRRGKGAGKDKVSMQDGFIKLINDVKKHRSELHDKMSKPKSAPELSKGEKKLLADEGYIARVMNNWGLVDHQGKPTSRYAGCIMSRHQTSLGGTLGAMATTAFVGGGVIGLYKILRTGQALTTGGKFMAIGGGALSALDWAEILPVIEASCFDKTIQFPASKSMSSDFAVGEQERMLQKWTGLFMSGNFLSDKHTPACAKSDTRDTYIENMKRSNCITDIINTLVVPF